MEYSNNIREHLSNYKVNHLKVLQNGIWTKTGKSYPHILPKKLEKLNILESYRDEFWNYYAKHKEIKLHKDFHHLNSSQAMCFNLFFPFIYDEGSRNVLFYALGIKKKEAIEQPSFEKIIDKKEGTTFDFYVKRETNAAMFFELKLSENEFGKAKNNQIYHDRLNKIYKPLLKNLIPNNFLSPETFFKHYQILQNISYIKPQSIDHLFFIFPRKNENLFDCVDMIKSIIVQKLQNNVSIIFLEDLLKNILDLAQCYDEKILNHYVLFKEKYII
jgi:hypothetical protein